MNDLETTASAHLPGLDVEIVHRRLPDENAEQISIHLKAMPSFEAFGDYLRTANPFVLWATAMQAAWAPWLAMAQSAGLPEWPMPRLLESQHRRTPSPPTQP